MVLKRVIQQFAELGMQPIVGPELEFYVLERTDKNPTGWQRYGEATGNVYVAGLKGDPENVLLRTLRHLSAFGLEVVAANHEFSSGQFEINLWHSQALDAADRAFRFKTAIQELARQEAKLATFMAKPFNDEGGSGFHIHFSTWDDAGQPLFDDPKAKDGLSKTGKSAIAGVLAHAPALAAISNPTINSYKRFGPDTLAPWLIDWGFDNRSAMVRIPPERGKASRMELRLGDASANPYLAIAGLLAAAYLGIRDEMQPPAPLEGYGYDPSKAGKLPGDLASALDRSRQMPISQASWASSSSRRFSRTSEMSWSASATGSLTGSSASTPTTCREGAIVSQPAAMSLDQVDLTDLDAFARNEGWAMFDTLRAEDPVHWTPEAPPNSGFGL